MVAVVEMAQLVDDDVVDDGLGSHHALPMEGELARGGAGGPSVTQLLHLDAGRGHADLRGVVVNPAAQALESFGDVKVAEGCLGRRNLALLYNVASQGEAAVFEPQGFVLIADEQESVRAPEVQETLTVFILAEHPGGVEVSPLGEALVDPVVLGLDDVGDLVVVSPLWGSNEHAAVALDDDVRR